jgi:hypothetical protein
MCLIFLQYWLSKIFIWTVLGDVDLHFSLILVTKANAVEGETTSSVWLYHQHNPNVTDGMTVTSLSANLQHKTGVARDLLCQITLNQKIWLIIYAKSHYTENYYINSKCGVNFQVVLEQNRAEKNHIKRDQPVLPYRPSSLLYIKQPRVLVSSNIYHRLWPQSFIYAECFEWRVV